MNQIQQLLLISFLQVQNEKDCNRGKMKCIKKSKWESPIPSPLGLFHHTDFALQSHCSLSKLLPKHEVVSATTVILFWLKPQYSDIQQWFF